MRALRSRQAVVVNARVLPLRRYQVAREIRMHSELYHENIISLFCAWKDAQYIHVAVEWAPNGDIYNMLKRFGGNGVSEPVIVTKVWPPRRRRRRRHDAARSAAEWRCSSRSSLDVWHAP